MITMVYVCMSGGIGDCSGIGMCLILRRICDHKLLAMSSYILGPTAYSCRYIDVLIYVYTYNF